MWLSFEINKILQILEKEPLSVPPFVYDPCSLSLPTEVKQNTQMYANEEREKTNNANSGEANVPSTIHEEIKGFRLCRWIQRVYS